VELRPLWEDEKEVYCDAGRRDSLGGSAARPVAPLPARPPPPPPPVVVYVVV